MNQQSPSQVLQNLFDVKKLPYGAQYEINRLVSVKKLTYDDILIEDVDKLAKMGTNREAAPATAKLMANKNSFDDDDSEGTPNTILHHRHLSPNVQCRIRHIFCQGTCRKSEKLLIYSRLYGLTRILFGCKVSLGRIRQRRGSPSKKSLRRSWIQGRQGVFGLARRSSPLPRHTYQHDYR